MEAEKNKETKVKISYRKLQEKKFKREEVCLKRRFKRTKFLEQTELCELITSEQTEWRGIYTIVPQGSARADRGRRQDKRVKESERLKIDRMQEKQRYEDVRKKYKN